MELSLDGPLYIAGHRGLVGSALLRHFQNLGCREVILRTRSETDLLSREAVFQLFEITRPHYVLIAAAKVGGIAANMAAPVEFLLENLKIQNNLLEACLAYQVPKTVFLASSCIYPRDAPQPMREESFMQGPVEPTNESYSIAKIAGIRLSQALRQQHGLNVICPVPSNVYGPGDHFEFERSHVVSALVRRFVEAKRSNAASVTLWGTGAARRELLHVDDLASACSFLLREYDSPDIINVGSGEDLSIRELAEAIAGVVGYHGSIEWDTTQPDGMPRKLMDVGKLRGLGWRHGINLEAGLRTVVADFERRFIARAADVG